MGQHIAENQNRLVAHVGMEGDSKAAFGKREFIARGDNDTKMPGEIADLRPSAPNDLAFKNASHKLGNGIARPIHKSMGRRKDSDPRLPRFPVKRLDHKDKF